jgi:hypothetical protein
MGIANSTFELIRTERVLSMQVGFQIPSTSLTRDSESAEEMTMGSVAIIGQSPDLSSNYQREFLKH